MPSTGPIQMTLLPSIQFPAAALAVAGLASIRHISTSPAHGISNSTLDPSLARRTTPTNFGIRCCQYNHALPCGAPFVTAMHKGHTPCLS